ncbi:hypothetical protein [Roseibium sp.]|uniref:hypothetical protein n=1 Tax=Roseibium sp. TaxID=1936156 RepID=UPI003BA93DE5
MKEITWTDLKNGAGAEAAPFSHAGRGVHFSTGRLIFEAPRIIISPLQYAPATYADSPYK